MRSTQETKKRRLAQFRTPAPVAEAMARWVAGASRPRTLLEPAAGDGALLEACLSALPSALSLGLDIDPAQLARARARLGRIPRVRLLRRDYLRTHLPTRFDAIAANPPYLGYRTLPDRRALGSRVGALWGERLAATTNAYALFLLKSLHELALGGRLAYLVPSEMLDMDWGEPVKRVLLRAGLRGILAFEPSLSLFQGALTTSALLLCERSPASRAVAFGRVRDPEQLPGLLRALEADGAGLLRVERRRLDPAEKWGALDSPTPRRRESLPLSAYGRCLRGLATGHNGFFLLTPAEASARGLARHATPCVAKARHAPGTSFTRADAARLLRDGERCLLLDPAATTDASLRRYLAEGVSQGVHRRHLPSRRRPWYAREGKRPADLWLPVFFRKSWRAVDNRAETLQLTAFHGLHLNALGRRYRARLWRWLNSPPCRTLVEAQARRLGGGLRKLEPKDAERLPTPDFRP